MGESVMSDAGEAGPLARFMCGDARDELSRLDPGSVDCCITSPPYYGLRDYHTGRWSGGAAGCDHERNQAGPRARCVCRRCGAIWVDPQIGIEETMEDYVATLVDVFRGVRRVLKPTGTLWLTLGDTFRPRKQLAGLPWLVAFALQRDGWVLRSDIIWVKPNPMPETVRDRPTRSHEYVFLFAASTRYHYDSAAVCEPTRTGEHFHGGYDKPGILRPTARRNGRAHKPPRWNGRAHKPPRGHVLPADSGDSPPADTEPSLVRNKRDVWTAIPQFLPGPHFARFPEELVEPMILAGCPTGGVVLDPFVGSGTTAAVALRLGRRAIGVDLNPAYIAMAERRARQLGLPLEATQ